MAVLFLFLRNVLLQIEISKIKIPEHSDPPSQHFSVHKAFRHSFLCRGKVVLCHPAEWHNSIVFMSVELTIFTILNISKNKTQSNVDFGCRIELVEDL